MCVCVCLCVHACARVCGNRRLASGDSAFLLAFSDDVVRVSLPQ